jgi:hypothetical protein
MKVRQQMAVLGLMIIIIFLKNKEELCCGAVPGSSFLRYAVLRPVTTAIGQGATSSATMLVFVLSALLRALFSSFLYFILSFRSVINFFKI